MCCIFTCFGWALDLVQRCWTFAMSWMISSAICCFTMTASMSGVALGYNYSLAEYIELKETNVSVYLKRGVFDDEVVDEMDWRRSGGGGPAPESQEPAQEPYNSGRRSNVNERRESIFDTTYETPIPRNTMFNDDEHHQFEGSLMKLTARPKPGDAVFLNKPVPVGYAQPQSESMDFENRRKMDYPSANIEKASENAKTDDRNQDLQSIQKALLEKQMAARQFATQRPTKVMELHPTATYPPGASLPPYPPPRPPGDSRRMMDSEPTVQNDIMSLVRQQENEKPRPKWYEPRPPKDHNPIKYMVSIKTVKTPRPGPIKPKHVHTIKMTTTEETVDFNRRRFGDKEFFSSKIGPEKDIVSIKDFADSIKDYSDEEIKGLPIRKKRHIESDIGFGKTQILHSYDNENDNIVELPNSFNLNKKEKNFLLKFIDAIKNVNNIFSFGETVSKEIAQRKIVKPTLDMAHLRKSEEISAINFGSSPGTLLSKIMKSTVAS